jgi:protein-tyrosine phosphatase
MQRLTSLFDLHCHIIPGVDDGSPDLETSLAMAQMSASEGVRVIACTPHILPGVYDNTGPDIRSRVQTLQSHLDAAGIDCRLVVGCDAHIARDLVGKLRSGLVLSIHDSRYVLVEPPHHFLPPNVDRLFFDLLAAGYVPVLTHPERMCWADHNDDLLHRLIQSGAWMQVTAGSILGGFGQRAKRRAEQMLSQGWVHIVASDAHNTEHRPPTMGQAFRALCDLVGFDEAENLVKVRPGAILENRAPDSAPALPYREPNAYDIKAETFFGRAVRHFRG